MIQGKIERWHQTLKNRKALEVRTPIGLVLGADLDAPRPNCWLALDWRKGTRRPVDASLSAQTAPAKPAPTMMKS
jgi:hypothetical protein